MFDVATKQKESSAAVRNKASASAHPSRAPNAATVQLSRLIRNAQIQPKLKIGEPNDKYEQEADQTAERAMKSPEPVATAPPDVFPETCRLPPQAPAVPIPFPNVSQGEAARNDTKKVKVSGKKVFWRDRSRFSASHGDEAGTTSNSVISLRDRSQPSPVPPVIIPQLQQSRQQPEIREERQQNSAQRAPVQVLQVQPAPQWGQRLGGAVGEQLAALAQRVPGYALLTQVVGSDPISGGARAPPTTQLFTILLGQVANGSALYRKVVEEGLLGRAAAFLQAELARHNLTVARLRRTISAAHSEMDFFRLDAVAYNLRVMARHLAALLADVRSLAESLFRQLFDLLKEALRTRLAGVAQRLPGFFLLTMLIGHNPITGEAVERSPVNLVRGLLEFVPGGREKFRNLQQTGALERAFEWIEFHRVLFMIIRGRLREALTIFWVTLSLNDILHPLDFIARTLTIFYSPLQELLFFAISVGLKVDELIVEAVMGLGSRVLMLLQRSRAVFLQLARNPVAFAANLVRSVRTGLRSLAALLASHVARASSAWLARALRLARLFAEELNLRRILSLVERTLGIDLQRLVRGRLVRRFGRYLLAFLQRRLAAVRRLLRLGPFAALRLLRQTLVQLRDRIFGPLRSFVVTRIVRAAVARLLRLFNPAGTVIAAIRAIYRTVSFFIERAGQIAGVVAGLVGSIFQWMTGTAGRAMAGAVPLVLGFLARFLGVTGIAARIRRIIVRLRRPVDRVINLIAEFLGRQVERWLRRLRVGTARARRGRA